MMLNHLVLGQSLLKAPLNKPSQRTGPQARSHRAMVSWLKHELTSLFIPVKRNQVS